ncbi:A-kinase anchor protein inhibitor 1 [Cavia porcellus]|uniref:A-kinase anchor protein inhibitor 1 n=1 Tax=Cavia porcellus TaxID=10141 RepID=UPI002FE155C0
MGGASSSFRAFLGVGGSFQLREGRLRDSDGEGLLCPQLTLLLHSYDMMTSKPICHLGSGPAGAAGLTPCTVTVTPAEARAARPPPPSSARAEEARGAARGAGPRPGPRGELSEVLPGPGAAVEGAMVLVPGEKAGNEPEEVKLQDASRQIVQRAILQALQQVSRESKRADDRASDSRGRCQRGGRELTKKHDKK